MTFRRVSTRIRALAFAFLAVAAASAQSSGTALVRHAPALNSGTIDGSVHQMLPESVTLNGGAVITGDLFVPGTPTVRLNGKPVYAGTIDGSGVATPTNYQVTLNGNVRLRNLVRRTNATPLPAVAPPPAPTGTRTLVISATNQSAGDFATLRHLTLNGGVGQFAVPPGTYGDFTANGGSGFTLGIAGATQPAVYNFQRLTLNGQTQVQVVGPVIINVANGFTANGTLGAANAPSRLTLNIYSGGFTLNGGCSVHGYVNAPHGTVIINGNSQLIGGAVCDRLTVNGGGLLRLHVAQAPNQPPIAHAQNLSTNEDTAKAITLTGDDADGHALTYTIVSQPLHGTLSGAAPNLTYTPAANYHGADSFTFKVNDGSVDSAPATIALTVISVNDPPVADPKTIAPFDEDTSATIILTGSDIEGSALTFNVTVEPQHGTLTGTGATRTYTPHANYYGADQFSYVTHDGAASSTPVLVSLTIRPINDAPIAASISRSGSENTDIPVTLSATDIENDPLTFTVLGGPTHGTLSGTPPHLVYRSASNFSGIDSFTYKASDGQADSGIATVTLAIDNPNDPPSANPQAVAVIEDTPKSIVLAGTDPDGDTLTFEILSLPQHGTIAGGTAATRLYTPEANYFGTDSFTFRVSDGTFQSSPATVTLNIAPINDAPAATAQTLQTAEDTPLHLTLSGTDVEGSALTFSIVANSQNGVLSGAGATRTYTPHANFHGTDTFTFKANDGELDSPPATISITITPVNDAPIATAQTGSTSEDTPLILTLAGTDVENSPLTFSITTPPQHGTYTLNGATFTYTPAANYHGPDAFAFIANDGELDSLVPATVSLSVTSQNDAPIAANQTLNIPENAPANLTLGAADADGDTLTYSVLTQPTHGTLSGAAPNLTYTPAANYTGPDSFTFKATDTAPVDSNTATISIIVYDVNTPPTAANQAVETDEDTARTFALNVVDADNDALTYTLVTPPSNGVLAGFPSAATATAPTITYTPAANFAGTDSFTYQARDGSATPAQATVTLTVRPINDAPIANAQAVSTAEDMPLAIVLGGTDPENATLTFTILAAPTRGSLNGTAPNLTYVPAPNAFGPDSFTFKVNDGQLDSAPATVAITVTPVNDAPAAALAPITLAEDTSIAVVLAATDVENDPLTFSYTQPAHGSLSGTAPNLTYTPHANYFGADSFTYKARDTGPLDSNTATVSITVTPVNDRPIANARTVFTQTSTPTPITLTGSDIENSPLTFTIVTPPQHGTLSGTPPNVIYTSAADFGGFDSFTFKVNDGDLDSSSATVQITSGLPPRSRTYTTTADFAAGTLTSLDTGAANQISNAIVLAAFDTVWIANSSKGTVIKLDSETGRALGEYLTAPAGVDSPYPSRIAVDSKGNAWVANYSHDSIVKIGNAVAGAWSDRNQNALPDTSGELGDVRPWLGTDVSGATDESILLYVRTGGVGVRHLSIDADDNVWVGSHGAPWQKFDGRTGAPLRAEPSIGLGGHGGFIAPDGKMYSAGTGFLIWNPAVTPIASLPQDDRIRLESWGSALDSKGNLWTTRDWNPTVAKYSPSGELLGEFYHGEPWAMGIAIDANDHVWIAHSHCGRSVGHLLPDGTFLGNVEVANHGPVEVSIDRRGRIWVVSSTGVVERINPLGGPLGSDGVTPVGEVDIKSGNLGGTLWTYGRFTGSSFALSFPDGFWTNVFDGQLAGATWGPVVANGRVANDGNIQIEAALSADGANYGPFQLLTFAIPTPSGAGRYLKTRVRLVSSTTGEPSALHDLTVGTAGYTPPTTTPTWSVSAGPDIAGNWPDEILLPGAFVHSLHAFPTEPSYLWSEVSKPAGAEVVFDDRTARRTNARFSAQGTYVLRLTATLGGQTSTDDVRVVLTPYNRAPYVNAGYTTYVSSMPPQIWLWGAVRDDGLPVGATVTSTWEKLFGPGEPVFANPHSQSTTASFPVAGAYTLRLSATDGELASENTTDVWIGVPPPPPAPVGIVSWWQASGNGDDHISGNQAFLERGTDFAEGKISGAFRFDGFDDRVRVFSAPSLDVGRLDGITVEFWLRPSADRIASLFHYGQGAASGFQIRQVNRTIEANFRADGGPDRKLSTGTVLTVDTWTHVAASYDRRTGEARIFVNGILQTVQNLGSFVLGTNFDIFLGRSASSAEPYFGRLDEVAVYNRALYGDEVLTIATQGKRPPVSNLPPKVDAGPDLINQRTGLPVALAGAASDDGQPINGALTSRWSKSSGPGTVTFTDATQLQTNAIFSAPGKYVLKLIADDGAFTASDTVSVLVDARYALDTDSSLSAWWTGNATDLDEVNGLKLERINGPAFADGRVDGAFSFDGVNDRARVLPASAINLSSSPQGFTIEFWMNHSRSSFDTIFQWVDASGNTQLQVGAALQSGVLFAGLFGRNAQGGLSSSPALLYAINQWNHIAFSCDATTGEVIGYLNGRRQFAAASPWNRNPLATNGALWVGSGLNGVAPFQGLLDEISLYRRVLSADEIAATHQAGTLGKAPLDDNAPPVISAGTAQVLANAGGVAALAGNVTDDGKPPGSLAVTWTKVDGPGQVAFANPAAPSTSASFDAPGIYTLRLDAHDTLNERPGEIVEVRVGVVAPEPAPGIAAWWSGNATRRELIRGIHNVQFANGTNYAAGKVAQGFGFDGNDDLAWVPGHSDLAIGASLQGFTIEFWMRPLRDAGEILLQWRDASGNTQIQVANGFYFGRWLGINLRDAGGTTRGSFNLEGTLYYPIGEWSHIAFVYDRPSGEVGGYLNGVRRWVMNVGAFEVPSDGTLWIGSGANGNTRFQGILDEITLYKRPLTYDEIKAVYDAGAAGKSPPDDNLPPVVNAGPDRVIPNIGTALVLNGSVIDDNKPFGPPLTRWSKVEGPGDTVFADPNAATTSVSFTAAGTYLLKLEGSDRYTTPISDLILVRAGVTGGISPDTSLAAWWPANGDPREVVRGNHDVQLINGAGYSAGRVAQGFSFNGNEALAWVPGHSDLAIGMSPQGFTIEFWMLPLRDAGEILMQWRDSSGNSQIQIRNGHYFGRWLGINVRDATGSTRGSYNLEGTIYYTIGAWNHIAFAYDRTTGQMMGYLNGARQFVMNLGAFEVPSDGTIWIGSGANGDSRFRGVLDEIALYRRPLSSADIASIFNAGAAGKLPNVAPVVDAGADVAGYINIPVSLAGTASDDGFPNPPGVLTSQWTVVSGPGNVVFATPAASSTTATFDAVGVYTLRLTAGDSALNAHDDVVITIASPPSQPPAIAIHRPVDGATLPAGMYFEIAVRATDSDGQIVKVEFFRGATKLGERTTPAVGDPATYFLAVPAGLPVGSYIFTATATDNSGATTTSAPASITVVADDRPPVAELATPLGDARISAPTPITGVAAGALLASWKLERRLKATEGATPEPWVTFASGATAVGTPPAGSTPAIPATLGTFDPTLLLNGIYELRLGATDSVGRTVIDGPITVLVEGNMKTGAFSIAFEDLKVPVAGVPITITRTYDSRDTRMGDFGPGWRLALNNVRVQKNTNLGRGWYQTPPPPNNTNPFFLYLVEPMRERIVTVTMPDGETHRFLGGAYVKNTPPESGYPDNSSLSTPATEGIYRFYAISDTTAKLEPLDSSNQLSNHFFIGVTGDRVGDQDLTFEDPNIEENPRVFNASRYRLTLADGTVFIVDEALGLLEMRDLDGNTLVLNRDAQNRVTGVTSTQNLPAAAGGPITRSVTIVRDVTGRVDYIRDPAGKDLDYLYDAQGRLQSFTNRELNVTQFRYENAAFPYYLTKIIDPRGVAALRSEYDPVTGKLVKQIDADGKETIFNGGAGVDAASRFEKIKDRLGYETTFFYDERGNVVTKIDPLGAQTSYNYWPDSDRVKFETDHYGNVKSFAYDARGNVTVQTIGASTSEDPANPTTGYTTRTSYNANSAPTHITDPDGRVQTFSYDPATNNLLTHTIGVGGAAPATTTYTYKSDGSLDTITDALGNTTSHSYNYAFSDPAYPGAVKQTTVTITDPAGAGGSDPSNTSATVLRVTRTVLDAQENQLAQIVTRTLPDGTSEDVITRYVYDAENRLKATILPDGRVTETRYTSFGKEDKTLLWRSIADYQGGSEANARVTSYGYDARGNQTSITHADGTSEQMSFDLENRKTWSQDRRGYRTFFEYDAVGRQRFTIHPDSNDGVGVSAPASTSDARLSNNPRSETRYDLVGRVRFQIDERGATTEFTYEDGCGCAMRRKEMIQHRTAGNLITSYTYDKAGNVRFVTDPRSNTVETRYDEQGRPRFVIYPATDEHPSTQTETKYDLLGRRTEIVDQEGKVTRYRYDGLGRLVEVRQYLDQSLAAGDAAFAAAPSAAGIVSTRYSYDALGNQQTQTDALGRVTTYVTDALGRRTQRILPKDASEASFLTETLHYDDWGNLWKRTDFAGRTTTFGYDTLNRLKSKSADSTHPSLSYSHAIARMEYDYDANGARIAARTFSATNAQLYTESTPRDERGRIDYKDTATGRLDYGYYSNNLLKDVVSSNTPGVNVGYRYDELNRLESVDDASTGLPTRTTSYAYNANGSLEAFTQPNGVTHTYGYDALNRLRGLVVAHGSTLIHTYEYKLRASGHRRQVIENSAKTTTYTYDDLYRLTNESVVGDAHSNNGDIGYTLDKVGNRLSRSSQLSAISNQLNQTYNARDWLNGDTYTANGSTIAGQLADAALRGNDVYDFEERLILRTKSDGATINIAYDADGHRIAKNILGASAQPVSSTTWLVDTNNLTGYAQVLEEKTTAGTNTTLRVYSYGTSLINQATSLNSQPAMLSYCAFDGHGNVRELTSTSGSVSDRYDYDAFGNLTLSSGSSVNAYRYCGEQYDPDLGLYYLRARYLNPDSGRFWSMDAHEGMPDNPPSLHKYLYASSNPVMFRDPSGHFTIGDAGSTAGVVGKTAGIATPAAATVGAKAAGTITAGFLGNLAINSGLAIGAYQAFKFQIGILALESQNRERIRGCPRIVWSKSDPGIKAIAEHIEFAQGYLGLPKKLHKLTDIRMPWTYVMAILNRAIVLAGLPRAGNGMSWDEYPFASTIEGGRLTRVSVTAVPEEQNWSQGGRLAAFYGANDMKFGDCFYVDIVP